MVSQFFMLLLMFSVVSFTYGSDNDFQLREKLSRRKRDELPDDDDVNAIIERLRRKTMRPNRVRRRHMAERPPDPRKEEVIHKYFKLEELENLIFRLQKEHRDIMKVLPLGRSVANTTIYAVQISRDVLEKRKPLKPMVKFVANIHGNERIGYALLVSLLQYLVLNDNGCPRVTRMLNDTDIWIVPTMNPDGLQKLKFADKYPFDLIDKTNANGVDLDGNFPYKEFEEDWPGQPETRTMMDFIMNNPFVLSGNIQGGDMVVSYPWDYGEDLRITDDNDVFSHIAKKYAYENKLMGVGRGCTLRTFRPNGISNGNYLTRKFGGMQDFNYVFSNCFELTLYLCCLNSPNETKLDIYWKHNLNSMLSFIESTRLGLYGTVKDTNGQPIEDAAIQVAGRKKEVKTTADGEYWRLLVWGMYQITANAPGFISQEDKVTISENHPYVQHDFVLTPQGIHGVVQDENGCVIKNAVVQKLGPLFMVIKENVKLNKKGEYKCTVEALNKSTEIIVSAPGYIEQTKTFNLTEENPYVQQDFFLQKKKKSKFLGCI